MQLKPKAVARINAEWVVAWGSEYSIVVRGERGRVLCSMVPSGDWQFGEMLFVGRQLVVTKRQLVVNAGFVAFSTSGVLVQEFSSSSLPDGRQIFSSPSASTLLLQSDDGITCWDLEAGVALWNFPYSLPDTAVISARGSLACSRDGEVRVFSSTFLSEREWLIHGSLDDLAWGLDGQVLLGTRFGNRHGITVVMDLRDGVCRSGLPQIGAILATSTRGRFVLTQVALVDLLKLTFVPLDSFCGVFDVTDACFVRVGPDGIQRLHVDEE
jgi:hypothetical protein